MLTVTYPAGVGWARAFVVDQDGFVLSEVTIARNAGAERNVIAAYLPPYIKLPRWDGCRWTEAYGWYRWLWRCLQRNLFPSDRAHSSR